MPEHDTPTRSPATTRDQRWDNRPALTLLGVIVTWYVGVIGIVLAQVL